MLQYSAFNMEMISARCGFSDSAYFHRVFRRFCGETPAAYRRRTARPTA
jgi:AraC-like DNA-binding protein